MKYLLIVVLLLFTVIGRSQDTGIFNRYFENNTLRIDYFHSGDAASEEITLDKVFRQGSWAGNPSYCLQPYEPGTYKISIYDTATNRLIFTKGYNTIFAEYQTIRPALEGIRRTFHESVLIPCPKKPFQLILEKRDRYNKLHTIFAKYIDPLDYRINNEQLTRREDLVIPVTRHGNPHDKVDLVILAEGYTAGELDKFKTDLTYFTQLFFTVEPFRSEAASFNISGVFSASEESGTDEPLEGLYKNTVLGSSFGYFDLDRYCLVDDNKSIRDMAGQVPYDAILIMINKDRYGGGGIYNWQTVFTAASGWRDYVFLHEFGHAFAGLADEYFSSPVAYVDFYTPGVEPVEPNITALPDTAEVKWKQYLSPGIAVPTEWGKTTYDSLVNRMAFLNDEMEMLIGKLKNANADSEEIKKAEADYQMRIYEVNTVLNEFFKNHPLKDKVGVFEGANYTSKGLYRPTLMSLMHKFQEGSLSYDKVNEAAIRSAINYYTGK